MHTGGAGAYDDAGELVLGNGVLYHVLSCLRTHILIVGGENNARLVSESLCHRLYVNRSGNICAAVADKNSDSLHGYFSFLILNIYASRLRSPAEAYLRQ